MSIMDDLLGGVTGQRPSDVARRSRRQGLGAGLSGVSKAPSTGLNVAAMFGGAGDITDVQSAISGRYQGQELSTWERLLGALPGVGLAAVVPLGVLSSHRASLVQSAFHRAQSEIANGTLRESNPGALRQTLNRMQMHLEDDPKIGGVSWRAPQGKLSRFAPWNRTAPPPEHVFGTFGRFTNRQLLTRATDDPFGDVARGLWDLGPVDPAVLSRADLDELEVARVPAQWQRDTASWVYGLGTRLITEVDENAAAVSLYKRRDDAIALTAGYEFARFHDSVKHGRLGGKRGERAADLWARFRSGSELGADEMAELGDAVVGHARLMQPFSHPELSLHPYLWVKGVDLEKGSVSMGVLPFTKVPMSEATPDLIDDRLKYIVKNNPAWLVDAARSSLMRFWDDYVTDEDITKFKDWYPTFKADVVRAAKETGFNDRKLVSIASILSAGETAETNVNKAAEAVKEMRASIEATGRKGAVARIHKSLKAKGFKVSEADVQRLILLDEVIPDDAPVGVIDDFWYQGAKSVPEAKAAGFEGPLKTKEVMKAWEDGGDLRQLILGKTYKPGTSLKQPSFDDAIWRSAQDEVIDRALTLARMVTGDLGRSDVAGDTLRRSVPVVSDRQAFKIALGFSMSPGTWFSGDVGAYDAVSQSIRQASVELSQRYGDFLSPEEIQAVTWMRYREAANVTHEFDPNARPPKGTWKKGFQEATTAKAGTPTGGGGPQWIAHREVLDVVLGEAPGVDFIPRRNLSKTWRRSRRKLASGDLSHVDPTTPQYRDEAGLPETRPTLQGAGEFELRLLPDGTFDVLTGPDAAPVRGLAASTIREADGRQVMFPVRPDPVDDAERFLRDRALGTAWNPNAPQQWVPARGAVMPTDLPEAVYDGRPVVGVTLPVKGRDPEAELNGLAAELRQAGVNVEAELRDPYTQMRLAQLDADGNEVAPPGDVFREVSRDEFVEAISTARAQEKRGRPVGETVHQYDSAEYADMRTFLSEDGLTGYALKPDGDFVSLFNVGPGGRGEAAVRHAVDQGARKLDAFDEDGFLTEKYGRFGFQEKGRAAWDPEQKPAQWSGGQPDVVLMGNKPEVVTEPVQTMWLTAGSEADLERAVDMLSGRQADTLVFSASSTPPAGYQRAHMRLARDATGRLSYHLTRSGSSGEANVVPVDVPDSWKLPDNNESLLGTRKRHLAKAGDGQWSVDGRALLRVTPMEDGTIGTPSDTLFNVNYGKAPKVDDDGKPVLNAKGAQVMSEVKADKVDIEFPPRGVPVVTLGHSERAPIAVRDGRNVVRLSRSDSGWDFEQADDGLPLWLVEEARQLLHRIGYRGGFGVKEP